MQAASRSLIKLVQLSLYYIVFALGAVPSSVRCFCQDMMYYVTALFPMYRFLQCTHLKMYYITPTDYDDFISIILAARSAYQMTPGGMVQFNELLQALRR